LEPHAHHDFGLTAPFVEEFGNEFGWVLEVGVDGNGSIPFRLVQTGGSGDLFAEVAHQLHVAHMLIFVGYVSQ
jgi:hypothetical protein